MSYELDYEHAYRCPCGAGVVMERGYSNDWFQHEHSWSIDCVSCKATHQVAVRYLHYLTEPGTTTYAELVPVCWPEEITRLRQQINAAQEEVVALARSRYRDPWVDRLKECQTKAEYYRALRENCSPSAFYRRVRGRDVHSYAVTEIDRSFQYSDLPKTLGRLQLVDDEIAERLREVAGWERHLRELERGVTFRLTERIEMP